MDVLIMTQGIQGRASKTKEVGQACIMLNNIRIWADNYIGIADSYKRRKEPLITIEDLDDDIIFRGTKEDLINQLK